MTVSIIIPHHNGKKLLFDCVDSIYKNITTQDFEVIVVDNMSNDNSAEEVKEKLAKKGYLYVPYSDLEARAYRHKSLYSWEWDDKLKGKPKQ